MKWICFILFGLLSLNLSAQEREDSKKRFDAAENIPLDSIKRQPITNEFLLGRWAFKTLKVEDKAIEKALVKNSELLEFKFYIDHQMLWFDGADTAKVVWDLVPADDSYDLRVYQPMGKRELHSEPAVLKILKLKKQKIVLEMTFQGVEELETPFQVIFKRKM